MHGLKSSDTRDLNYYSYQKAIANYYDKEFRNDEQWGAYILASSWHSLGAVEGLTEQVCIFLQVLRDSICPHTVITSYSPELWCMFQGRVIYRGVFVWLMERKEWRNYKQYVWEHRHSWISYLPHFVMVSLSLYYLSRIKLWQLLAQDLCDTTNCTILASCN